MLWEQHAGGYWAGDQKGHSGPLPSDLSLPPPSPGPALRLPEPQQLIALLPQHAPTAAPAPAEPCYSVLGPARGPCPASASATEWAGPGTGSSGAGDHANGRGAVGWAGGQRESAPQWAPGGVEWGCCSQPCGLEPGWRSLNPSTASLSQQVRENNPMEGNGRLDVGGIALNTPCSPKGKKKCLLTL